ncbi:MAG: DUF177 domain-containing protein [Bacteroidetes bacterium]|jgi:uncharacterized metal-binding protein YceD (DUF177 family)|nr:DUF177 domain-containing protein [Bacteroidota bacterium]
MDKLRNYEVGFSGLKEGKHNFQFEIGTSFFELFDTEQEFSNPIIKADILLDKHSTFLEFWIKIFGTVDLVCDISNETFRNPIENDTKFLVKFGEEYDDSNEEVITIPQHEHAFNVAQIIYELVTLSIPMKKLSPNLSQKDLEILEKFSPQEIEEKEEQKEEIDPRWEALRQFKNKN